MRSTMSCCYQKSKHHMSLWECGAWQVCAEPFFSTAGALLPKLGHHSPRATCVSLESVQRRVIWYLRVITRGEGSKKWSCLVWRGEKWEGCGRSVVQEVRGFLERGKLWVRSKGEPAGIETVKHWNSWLWEIAGFLQLQSWELVCQQWLYGVESVLGKRVELDGISSSQIHLCLIWGTD